MAEKANTQNFEQIENKEAKVEQTRLPVEKLVEDQDMRLRRIEEMIENSQEQQRMIRDRSVKQQELVKQQREFAREQQLIAKAQQKKLKKDFQNWREETIEAQQNFRKSSYTRKSLIGSLGFVASYALLAPLVPTLTPLVASLPLIGSIASGTGFGVQFFGSSLIRSLPIYRDLVEKIGNYFDKKDVFYNKIEELKELNPQLPENLPEEPNLEELAPFIEEVKREEAEKALKDQEKMRQRLQSNGVEVPQSLSGNITPEQIKKAEQQIANDPSLQETIQRLNKQRELQNTIEQRQNNAGVERSTTRGSGMEQNVDQKLTMEEMARKHQRARQEQYEKVNNQIPDGLQSLLNKARV